MPLPEVSGANRRTTATPAQTASAEKRIATGSFQSPVGAPRAPPSRSQAARASAHWNATAIPPERSPTAIASPKSAE